ncbi:hypothetical protein B9Q01_04795 [Candidatus Marsarchaeota G1 archaeon OSP_D]|uniref:Luciferase-like domain-containing protein n=3 Tax=Candidatus Marsarchaeota group 1 TaxID=2203770 RepID=A0A2R6AI27_9ARCH|nr:MAG: hypothetical protein B9Q01_04795 [Candidatus Marsarchaeota G1 archaeon OSP_D]PSN85998.1 MAG: hypothetical protein B9Q02_04020 [Candidatus Marsarchaeota G1 archaeon BE_D]PSN88218.1 MAG: hypothetical protein B9Q00_06245 [Candidatus Marsarchaeota G1 archaeon OSP_C]
MVKWGVTFDWRNAEVRSVIALCKKAEEACANEFWVPEAWSLEAFSVCGALLASTQKITVGTGVVNVFSRSAALIGMACATLSQFGEGRFALGLGVSAKRVVEDWHGIPFERPYSRLLDYLRVIRQVAHGKELSLQTKTPSRFRLFTQPVKELRVYLAALGEKSLKIAAKFFDGAIVTFYPFSKLDKALKILNGKELVAYYPVALTEDTSAIERIKRLITFYVCSMGDYYYSNLKTLGYENEVERMRSLYHSGKKDEAVNQAKELLDELSLIGSASQIAEKVKSVDFTPVFALDSPDTLQKIGAHLKDW